MVVETHSHGNWNCEGRNAHRVSERHRIVPWRRSIFTWITWDNELLSLIGLSESFN